MRPWYAFAGVILGLSSFASVGRADYLELRRNAQLKRAAEPEGQVLEKLIPGTLVELTKDEQEDGYYRVRTRDGKRGYVYRTLVRRHPGSIPPVAGGSPAPEADEGEVQPDPVEGTATSVDLSGPYMRAHLINVGQGAATLFEFACGAVLIDTGGETNGEFNSADALRSHLDEFFDKREDLNRTIDLLVITHPHIDHARNVKLVAEEFTLRNVVTDGLTKGATGTFFSGGRQQAWLEGWAQEHAHLETVQVASIPKGGKTSGVIDPIHCADEEPKIRVLWGALDARPVDWSAKAFGNANNHSVVVRIDFGRSSFLVSGDLEEDAIPGLVAKHQGSQALDIDVWEVSHHGSHNGTGQDILDALTPEVALLATGSLTRELSFTAWAYGHPRETVINQLLASLPTDDAFHRVRSTKVPIATASKAFKKLNLDEAIYATGWDGTVVVTADADGSYDVQTER